MRYVGYVLALLLVPLVYGLAQMILAFWSHQPQHNDLAITTHPPEQFWWGFFYNRNNRPDVLLIGDSISDGYRPFVIWQLRDAANIDSWVTPLGEHEQATLPDLQQVLSFRNYDIIHFNTGLHGLDQTPQQTLEHVQHYLHTIKQYAPHARLIWASITPMTVNGDKLTLDADVNPSLIEKNALIAQLMQENGVAINDLYTLMTNNLHTGLGDRYHWRIEGSRLMADQVASAIRAQIKSNSRDAVNIDLYYFVLGVFSGFLMLWVLVFFKAKLNKE